MLTTFSAIFMFSRLGYAELDAMAVFPSDSDFKAAVAA
jgi:hypothetical protein